MKYLAVIISTLITWTAGGQTDSTNILGLDTFLKMVMTNHPVIKQSDLQPQFAASEIKIAKGSFDPAVSSDWDLKNFKDKEYYNLFNTTLKVPLWFPVDPKISIDRNTGIFLNPENNIPVENDSYQINTGISVPLGRGLIIDERRSILQQAKLLKDLNDAERTKIINKVLLTAIKDYWEWYLYYQEYRLLQRSIIIAQELFDRVIIDYDLGEASVVDTIQANIVLQARKTDFAKTNFDYINSGLNLSFHLWTDELAPVELQPTTIPDTLVTVGQILDDEALQKLLMFAEDQHPDIRKVDVKLQQLEVEQRWNKENLKPRVDLNYSFIDAPIGPSGESSSPSFNDNYKVGLDVYFPLFLRKERGKIQKTELKILDNQYEFSLQKQRIRNNLLSRYAEIEMAQSLAQQYQIMSENYDQLLQAEILNLETGESDLFKLNIQQDKYIEAQRKYFKAVSKFQKSVMEIYYDAGIPYLSLGFMESP